MVARPEVPDEVDEVEQRPRDECREVVIENGKLAREGGEQLPRAVGGEKTANTFVAGNAIFGSADPKAEIKALRMKCLELV